MDSQVESMVTHIYINDEGHDTDDAAALSVLLSKISNGELRAEDHIFIKVGPYPMASKWIAYANLVKMSDVGRAAQVKILAASPYAKHTGNINDLITDDYKIFRTMLEEFSTDFDNSSLGQLRTAIRRTQGDAAVVELDELQIALQERSDLSQIQLGRVLLGIPFDPSKINRNDQTVNDAILDLPLQNAHMHLCAQMSKTLLPDGVINPQVIKKISAQAQITNGALVGFNNEGNHLGNFINRAKIANPDIIIEITDTTAAIKITGSLGAINDHNLAMYNENQKAQWAYRRPELEPIMAFLRGYDKAIKFLSLTGADLDTYLQSDTNIPEKRDVMAVLMKLGVILVDSNECFGIYQRANMFDKKSPLVIQEALQFNTFFNSQVATITEAEKNKISTSMVTHKDANISEIKRQLLSHELYDPRLFGFAVSWINFSEHRFMLESIKFIGSNDPNLYTPQQNAIIQEFKQGMRKIIADTALKGAARVECIEALNDNLYEKDPVKYSEKIAESKLGLRIAQAELIERLKQKYPDANIENKVFVLYDIIPMLSEDRDLRYILDKAIAADPTRASQVVTTGGEPLSAVVLNQSLLDRVDPENNETYMSQITKIIQGKLLAAAPEAASEEEFQAVKRHKV